MLNKLQSTFQKFFHIKYFSLQTTMIQYFKNLTIVHQLPSTSWTFIRFGCYHIGSILFFPEQLIFEATP